MSWVNFNFKFMSSLRKCEELIEVDVYSTVITTIGVLFGTFFARALVNDYLVKWWLRRKVSNVCLSVCNLRQCPNMYMWNNILLTWVTQGIVPPAEGVFPFPVWEVKMLWIESLGLSQAFGFALG
jgi:hypothetical protein